jgi:biopolymer transport protein TolR
MKIRRSMHGSARLADVEPDINITPLVDICLVLLIIFMVVAPRMSQDIQVDLPGIFNPDPDVKSAMDPIKVTIPKAGEYYINTGSEDRATDLDGMTAFLKEQHDADPFRKLVLRADEHLRYGDVRDVMARVQEIGFPGLSFLVGKRHQAGEEATSDVAANTLEGAPSGAAPAGTGAAPGNAGPAAQGN